MIDKEPKTLPQAIKIIVDRYGKDVLNDVRLVNIMSDVVTLEDSLAVKNTFRVIIKLGYGKKILSLVSAKGDISMKIRVYAKSIADTKGFNEVIIQYVLYSLSYGVGLCKEPYLKNTNVSSSPVVDRPPQKLHEEISEQNVDKSHFYKIIVGLISFFIFVGCVYLYQYYNSSADREQYEKRVTSGNNFLSKGDYDNAIESYKEAYNGYNALNSGSYKEAALMRMDDLVDKLCNEGNDNNKSLLQAYKLLQSEMQLNLDKEDLSRLQSKKDNIEKLINTRVSNGRNSLISIVSANNGKLDADGKALLIDLLELSPNDYWLNFIKKKSYE